MKALKISILFVLLLGTFFISNGNASDNLDRVQSLDQHSSEIFNKTNQYRVERNLKEFTFSKKLSEVAQTKANHMCSNNYFAHTLPNGNEWYTFLNDSGYNYNNAGENLGKGYDTTDNLFQAWLDSPKHKENIDKPYTHLGVGYSECEGKKYSVQVFTN